MTQLNSRMRLLQSAKEGFGNIDRAMLATRAANCNCHIGALGFCIGWQPAQQQVGDVANEFLSLGVALKELCHREVLAR